MRATLLVCITILLSAYSFAEKALCQKNNAQVLFENKEHYIYYRILREQFVLVVEDLRDNENNIGGSRNHGEMVGSCGTSRRTAAWRPGKWKTDFDAVLVEIDKNGNGKVDPSLDMGYFIEENPKYVYPHYLQDRSVPFAIREKSVNRNSKSRAKGNVLWKATSKLKRKHPVFSFTFPLEEILNEEDFSVSIRLKLKRTARNWEYGIDYGTFIYPEGSCNYDNATFEKVDLSMSGSPAIVKVKNRLKQEKEQKWARDFESKLLKNLVSVEAHRRATDKLPDYDGLFIETKEGKIIEIPQYAYKKAIVLGYKRISAFSFPSLFKKDGRPYYRDTTFNYFGIVKIRKNNLKQYRFVANDALAKAIPNQSLHKVEETKLSQGKLQLVEAPPNPNMIRGDVLENTTVYTFGKALATTKSDNLGFTASTPLTPGYYGVWANKHVWLFEIIE